jgi:rSAM/selenodomain-associated transferase 2
MTSAPLLSIVVPVRADEAAVDRLLQQIRPDPRLEIVVADGGGNPRLPAIVGGRADVALVTSPPGRAVQMNAGAAAARGRWLLFLHADSTLPDGWLEVLARWAPRGCGGWFRFALDDPSWQARVIERGVSWRIRLFRLPYGDQGLFVTRETFTALGGYRDLPIMEDVEFVRRLVRCGRVVELPLPLGTSARRWQEDGWLRRSLRNLFVLTLYFFGVSPVRLARIYSRRRKR